MFVAICGAIHIIIAEVPMKLHSNKTYTFLRLFCYYPGEKPCGQCID